MRRLLPAAALLLLSLCAWAEDPTVYVTRNGAKYHREFCPALRMTMSPLPLSEAVALGYEPCKLCRPPEPKTLSPSGRSVYRVNAANVLRSRDADFAAMLPAEVIGHIDGDTVRVEILAPPAGISPVETVRLLGIDAPEMRQSSKVVQALAEESSAYAKDRLLGKQVYLAFDWDLRDRYRRLLAYVYLPDGSCHNADMVKDGFAHAYTRFPFQFLEEFRALEREAREQRRGLWR